MARMPGITFDQGAHPGAALVPVAGIIHRTIGHWAGDYHIGKFDSGPPDFAGFHFLVGQAFTQVAQFYDTGTVCNHAAGANDWAIGIEFSGQNFEPLTEWQIAMGGEIVRWASITHHIPATWYDGARIGKAPGWRGHVSVATVTAKEHYDTITRSEFGRLMSTPQVFTPPATKEFDVQDTDITGHLKTIHGEWLQQADGGIQTVSGDYHGSYPELVQSGKADKPRHFYAELEARDDGAPGYVLTASDATAKGGRYAFPV